LELILSLSIVSLVSFGLCQKHPEMLARPMFQSLSINWTIRKAFAAFGGKSQEVTVALSNLSSGLVQSLALTPQTDHSEWYARRRRRKSLIFFLSFCLSSLCRFLLSSLFELAYLTHVGAGDSHR
jgi:hypothetical protein